MRNQERKSVAFIDQWAGVGNPDFLGTAEAILAAKDTDIPVCYPNYVKDMSGRLRVAIPPSQLRQIQKPGMHVSGSRTQQLACTCQTCEPAAPPGFPPVCSDCTCQEALEHPEVYILGHEQACGEAGCNSSDKAKNAMHKWPQCARWACYNKDGWFCACTCPGAACPQPAGRVIRGTLR